MATESIVMVLAFVMSTVSLYFGLKKQKHEENALDADTIGKLYDLIDKQEKRYHTLRSEFVTYKDSTSVQISDIASENFKLRRWAKRLVAQLEGSGIVPSRFED